MGDFKALYGRDIRRGVHFLAVMAPFVAIGGVLDWAFGTALFRDGLGHVRELPGAIVVETGVPNRRNDD